MLALDLIYIGRYVQYIKIYKIIFCIYNPIKTRDFIHIYGYSHVYLHVSAATHTYAYKFVLIGL